MRDVSHVLHALSANTDDGAVLVTVLRTHGPAYRRAGAMAVLDAQGQVHGGAVSAGCLEADLAARVPALREAGRPLRLRYDADDDSTPWGLGLGCGGSVEVLLEPMAGAARQSAVAWLSALTHLGGTAAAGIILRPGQSAGREVDNRGVVRVVAAGDGEWWFNVVAGEKLTPMERRDIRADARRIAEQGASAMVRYGLGETAPEVAWFAVAPQPVLIIGGATPDSRPVAAQAVALGWHVTVIEHRSARAAAFQLPGVHVVAGDPEMLASAAAARAHAACVVMYHHREADQRALAALAAQPPGYVGMLGPRARTAELLHESGAASGGWPTWLRAPVGLDVGAEGADEVALSIVAELVAWSHGATGGALSARDGAIHLLTRADSLSGELLEWSRVPS